MFCTNCGKVISDDSTFCIYCGTQILSDIPFRPESTLEDRVNTKEKRIESERSIYNGKARKSLTVAIVACIITTISIVGTVAILLTGKNPLVPDQAEKSFSQEKIIPEEETAEEVGLRNNEDSEGIREDEVILSYADVHGEDIGIDEETDVEAEVEQIREWYYTTQNDLSRYEVYEQPYTGKVYCEGERIIKMTMYHYKDNLQDVDYTREFFFHDNEIYFVFQFGEAGEHRYYYKDGNMIRYINANQYTMDLDAAADYRQEAMDILDRGYTSRNIFQISVSYESLPETYVTAVYASSMLSGGDYDAENVRVFDGTCWAEGVEGNGIGEYLEFEIPAGVEIAGMTFQTGYVKSTNPDLYYKNGAPIRVAISSGGQQLLVDVRDTESGGIDKIITTPEISYDKSRFYAFDRTIVSDGIIRLTIVDVRPGTIYEDTCISFCDFKTKK